MRPDRSEEAEITKRRLCRQKEGTFAPVIRKEPIKNFEQIGDEMILVECEDFGVVPRICYRGVRPEAGRPDKRIFKIPGKRAVVCMQVVMKRGPST